MIKRTRITIVLCSWCKVERPYTFWNYVIKLFCDRWGIKYEVSHGMCSCCLSKQLVKIKEHKERGLL